MTREEKINMLITLAAALQRGCDCEYDYRCGRCDRLLRVQELAEELQSEDVQQLNT